MKYFKNNPQPIQSKTLSRLGAALVVFFFGMLCAESLLLWIGFKKVSIDFIVQHTFLTTLMTGMIGLMNLDHHDRYHRKIRYIKAFKRSLK